MKTIHNPLTDDIVALDSQVVPSEDPLPKVGSQSWLICGKPGTGKSTLYLGAITSKRSNWYAKKSFDNTFLCSPSAKRDPKFDDMISELTEEGHYFDTFSEEILEQIMDEIDEFNEQYKKDKAEWQANKEEHGEGFYTRELGKRRDGRPMIKKITTPRVLPRHLLILDDVVSLLPKSTQNSRINDMYCNMRHKKLCIITISQVFNKLNPIIRRNANMMSIFRTDNKTEYDAIENDLAVDPVKFKQIYDFATGSKVNDFLHIQMCGAKPIYFKKFDRIVEDN
jgi:hypothetical protein